MLADGIRQHRTWIIIGLVATLALLAAPAVMTPFYTRVMQLVILSAGLALAWSILGGLAGYWSFGHTVFVGVGAFSAALFDVHVPLGSGAARLVIGLLLGAGLSALLALAIAVPVLRLRGIYFAVAMLGVSQVVAELNNNLEIFQGSLGIVLPKIFPASVEPQVGFYYLFLGLGVLTIVTGFLIKISRMGYGLLAIREDEDTARMMGVPTERYKTAAFVISAALTGCFGVAYAHSLGYITTSSVYRVDFSLNMIVYALLGGMGTLLGPIVGAIIMIVLTQVVLGHLLDVHMLATGALLVALVLLAPHGLVGSIQRFLNRRQAQSESPADA